MREHFFKEHELGVGRGRSGETITYEVEHPFWRVYPIRKIDVKLDWEKIYGKNFSFLQDQKPISTFLAEGSKVKVFQKNEQ